MDRVFFNSYNSRLDAIPEKPSIPSRKKVESVARYSLSQSLWLARSLFYNNRDYECLDFTGKSELIVWPHTHYLKIQSFLYPGKRAWVRNLLIHLKISEHIVEQCFLLPRMEVIYIRGCKLSLQAFKNLSEKASNSLKTLTLTDCVFDLDSPLSSVISVFPKLRRLTLINCKGLKLDQFPKCPELDHLVLAGALRPAKEVPFDSLQTISIENSDWTDDEIAPFLMDPKFIKLVNCPNITANCQNSIEEADEVSMTKVPKLSARQFTDITNTLTSRIASIYIRESGQ